MGNVKILGIVGSPRHNSNTEVMVREALKGAEETGKILVKADVNFSKAVITAIKMSKID